MRWTLEQAGSGDAVLVREARRGRREPRPEPREEIVSLAGADPRIRAVEPERIKRALDERPVSLEYVRGFRDGVSSLYDRLAGQSAAAARGGGELRGHRRVHLGSPGDRRSILQAHGRGHRGRDSRHRIRPRPRRLRGAADRLAVVRRGPGRAGRQRSWHALHGDVMRSGRPPDASRRYGVASEATIFVGKVLSDQGSGTDAADPRGHRLGGRQRVRVISMSLGADVDQVSRRTRPSDSERWRRARSSSRRRATTPTAPPATPGSSECRRTARRSWRSPPSTRNCGSRTSRRRSSSGPRRRG